MKISESQSRYSIVERIVNKKLSLMDKGNCISQDIQNQKQKIVMKEKEYIQWGKSVLEDVERAKKAKEMELGRLKEELKFMENSESDKEDMITLQVKELEKALEAIQKISESAGTQVA